MASHVPLPTAHLVTALRWRYAVKQFDASRRIDAGTWSDLEQILVLTPSSLGLQPWKFIVVTDSTLRAALSAASYGQRQKRVGGCPSLWRTAGSAANFHWRSRQPRCACISTARGGAPAGRR